MQLRRLLATTAVAVAAATSLAACGEEEEPTHGKTEGVYVNTGELKYQVQISRQLNPSDSEDRDYLASLSAGDRSLGQDESWFGVFIRVFNWSDEEHPSASEFFIEDTTGKRFEPVELGGGAAYKPLVVRPGDSIPVPGSQARENPTQGGLILFKVPIDSYANRPLELHIAPPQGRDEATVDLDI
jgi:hypothetical protein